MREDMDLVSIIIPMHNAAAFMEETIDCILAQTYKNWELLLVDDCSTDNTVETVLAKQHSLPQEQSTKIQLLPQTQNQGAARSRNLGLAQSQGRFVCYLDADDLWSPEKLEHQVAFMKEKGATFSFTGYEFADEQGKGTGKVVHVPPTISYKEALKNTTIFTSTVMFDTTKIDKEQLEMPIIKSEDTALWFRLLRQGITAYGLEENLVAYRRAGKSLSSNKLEALRRIWNLYRKAEGLSIPYSAYNFFFWAVRAVKRRI